jgi:hypothetical protein
LVGDLAKSNEMSRGALAEFIILADIRTTKNTPLQDCTVSKSAVKYDLKIKNYDGVSNAEMLLLQSDNTNSHLVSNAHRDPF